MQAKEKIKCVLHGSFRKDFDLIKEIHSIFQSAGINVIAPEISKIIGETDGFVHLENDKSIDCRVTELAYLNKVAELGSYGFSYYVNPDCNLGTSASYELAIDQMTNTRYLFLRQLKDNPVYVPRNSVWNPKDLANYVSEHDCYPPPVVPHNEMFIYKMMQDLILPGSIIAVGAIIVDYSGKRYKNKQERDVLLVQTHKWGGRFSVVGGKVRRNERLAAALKREIKEQTGLSSGIEESVCTFDELIGGGYFISGTNRVFADNVVAVRGRKVFLNDEAENYIWIPPSAALKELELEPNAKKTLEIYVSNHLRIS